MTFGTEECYAVLPGAEVGSISERSDLADKVLLDPLSSTQCRRIFAISSIILHIHHYEPVDIIITYKLTVLCALHSPGFNITTCCCAYHSYSFISGR